MGEHWKLARERLHQAIVRIFDHIGSGRPWDLDRRSGGVMVLQPYQTRSHAGWYRGTADAIAQNWDAIEESHARRVLVLPGDHVYKMDYRALATTHLERGARATIAVTEVLAEETGRFGMVDLVPVMPVEKPVGLGAIKAEARLAGFGLVRQGRLSVVPVSAAEWKLICTMGKTKA